MGDKSDTAAYADLDFDDDDSDRSVPSGVDETRAGEPTPRPHHHDAKPGVATETANGGTSGGTPGGTSGGTLSGTRLGDDEEDSIFDTEAVEAMALSNEMKDASTPGASAASAELPSNIPAGAPGATQIDAENLGDLNELALRRQRVDQSFILFVVSIVAVGVGVAFVALAALTRTTMWIALGATVGPAAGIWCRFTYKDWISNKRFHYRLLESLGEDTSEFEYEDKYRAARSDA